MKLYTFIADCEGGTFVSQHRSVDQKGAMLHWLKHLPDQLFEVVYGDKVAVELDSKDPDLPQDMLELVSVKGLVGVFGGYLSLNDKDIFLFVVETAKSGDAA